MMSHRFRFPAGRAATTSPGALLSLAALFAAFVASAHVAADPPRLPNHPPNLLERDSRLAAVVPAVVSNTITMPRLCAILRTADHVPTSMEEGEMHDTRLFLAFDRAPARAVMDAVAALWLVRWERTEERNGPSGYRLGALAEEISHSFTPKNEYKRRRNEAGMGFLAAIDGLTPAVRADLRAGKPVRGADLSREALQRIGEMINALNQEWAARNPEYEPFPVSILSQATITLSVHNYGEVQDWWVSINNSDGGMAGFAFDDYEHNLRQKQQTAVVGGGNDQGGQDSPESRYFAPVKFEVTQKEARTLPELRKPIRIERRRATLPRILRDLHERYGASIVADAPAFQTQVCDVSLDVASLPEAFDRLTQIYRDTQWEYRRRGLFVVRSASNPARTQ